MNRSPSIAYFSMEIGLAAELPTYAGGLGVLAGDTVRSAADRAGSTWSRSPSSTGAATFASGSAPTVPQSEEPVPWSPAERLAEVPARATVGIEGRAVQLRAWRYEVTGVGGHIVPVLFLDADVAENADPDRRLTDHLYGGDLRYRLCQELLLGIGGVRMLRALSFHDIRRFHMNEGHAAPLVLELGFEEMRRRGMTMVTREIAADVKRRCVFTTHTPVPTGHDQFPLALVQQVMTDYGHACHEALAADLLIGETLNMTYVALEASRYVNGVARRHARSRAACSVSTRSTRSPTAFTSRPGPRRRCRRCSTATSPAGARTTPACAMRSASRAEVWSAHQAAKGVLLDYVNQRSGAQLRADVPLGFARRVTAYKRPDLLFFDLARLLAIHAEAGPFRIVLAGKAHPQDHGGKALIRDCTRRYRRCAGRSRSPTSPSTTWRWPRGSSAAPICG